MNLVRYRRRGTGLASLQDSINDVFGRFFDDWEGPAALASWTPALDVAEREDAVVVQAELPGIQADDIELSVHGDTLVISGEKKTATDEQKDSFSHVERRYGKFMRTVLLPGEVDGDRIEARHHDGVLTVTLPKSEKAKPKRIPVAAE